MRFCFDVLVYLHWFFLLSYGHFTSEYDAPQEITFYHELDNSQNGIWVEKEIVKLHNINIGSVIMSQTQIPLSTINTLEEMNFNDRLYRMKALIRTAKGKRKTFYSFMKLVSLVNSGYLTTTIVHLDQSGSVICVKVYPKKPNHLSSSNSTIIFKGPEQGPMPDLTSYLLKLEREREAKEKGANQDNRSFLAKYWMYIVPVVMFAILTGAGDAAGNQQNSR